MSMGKLLSAAIVACALIAGGALYYLQVYAYYFDASDRLVSIQLRAIKDDDTDPIAVKNVQAIDADSSPIRYRACFELAGDIEIKPAELRAPLTAEPLNAPSWFDCFDAQQIGADLERGGAQGFIETENYYYGIDRIVAIYPSGRAFMWHQINACGEQVFDGKPAPEGCPDPSEQPNLKGK